MHIYYTHTYTYTSISVYLICLSNPASENLSDTAASVQNNLCVKLFILALLATIQEEQSQLSVESWLNSMDFSASIKNMWECSLYTDMESSLPYIVKRKKQDAIWCM